MTVLATDNFTRADGAIGANWTENAVAGGNFVIASNQAACTAGDLCIQIYTATAAPNDGYCEVTIGSIVEGSSDNGVGPVYRASSAALTMYLVQGNIDETRLYKVVAGGFAQLGSDGPSVATGDILRLTCNGTSLTVTKNGTSIITATDAAIASGGAGMWGASTGTADNASLFSFGDLGSGPVINTKSITETSTIADIKMKQLRMLRSDGITLADFLTRIGAGTINVKTLNEFAAIVDIEMKQLRMLRTEGITLSDVLSRASIVKFRTINESFAVDPDGSTAIANLFLGDPITLIDQLTRLGQIRAKSITEAITIIDVLTGIKSGSGIVNSKSILESITITDTLSTALKRSRLLNEALVTVDLLTRSITANRNLFDAVSIIDLESFVGVRNYVKSLFESLTIQDQMSQYLIKRIALLEAISMIDVDVGIYVPYSANLPILTSPIILGSG